MAFLGRILLHLRGIGFSGIMHCEYRSLTDSAEDTQGILWGVLGWEGRSGSMGTLLFLSTCHSGWRCFLTDTCAVWLDLGRWNCVCRVYQAWRAGYSDVDGFD